MTDHSQDGLSGHEFESLTTDDQFRKSVTQQFAAMNLRQSAQDVEIANVKISVAENTSITRQIAEDTKAMREAWADGVAMKRFFCRMAEAWTFILRKVFIPFVLPLTILWTLVRIVNHEALPDWANAAIKLIVAVL
jgi:hypothetical protein